MCRLDLVGGLLSVVTVGALVYAIIEGPHFGWHTGAITAAAIGATGLVAFVTWEVRHPSPILNVRKCRDRAFSGSVLAVLLFFLGAALTGMLTPNLGMKPVVVTGMAVGTRAILLLSRIGDGSTYSAFVPTLALLGLAIGLSTSPCTDLIMGSFPEDELGVGGGINDTAVEFGGSLGIAVLGSVLATTRRSVPPWPATCPPRPSTPPRTPSAAPKPWPSRSLTTPQAAPGRPRPWPPEQSSWPSSCPAVARRRSQSRWISSPSPPPLRRADHLRTMWATDPVCSPHRARAAPCRISLSAWRARPSPAGRRRPASPPRSAPVGAG
jgi:hypothetical protein